MALLFLRGWLQVALVAANVAFVGQQHYQLAFLSSLGISGIWWANSSSAGKSRDWRDGIAYTAGAACGTVSGMWLARWLAPV